MVNITSVYKSLGKLHEAEEAKTKTVGLVTKVFGADDMRMAATLVNFAELQMQENKWADAVEAGLLARGSRSRNSGASSPGSTPIHSAVRVRTPSRARRPRAPTPWNARSTAVACVQCHQAFAWQVSPVSVSIPRQVSTGCRGAVVAR
jgi:hypothetical protein